MVEKYYIDFINNSGRTWTMAAYQTLPDSLGLVSVSWLQTTVADGEESGVDWDMSYWVMLANYKQQEGNGVYKASQKKQTDLGKRWKIIYKDGVQQLVEDGDADRPDQIYILNASGETTNPGFGMSGQGSVYKSQVHSGTGAQFVVNPTYYVGLFNDLVLGEMISSNVIVGPAKLVFPSGFNKATLNATIDGSSLKLDINYSRVSSFSLEHIEHHLKALDHQQDEVRGDFQGEPLGLLARRPFA